VFNSPEKWAGKDGLRTEETPHPSGDGWRKRRRRTPSPQEGVKKLKKSKKVKNFLVLAVSL
jgi:hypothetical protein